MIPGWYTGHAAALARQETEGQDMEAHWGTEAMQAAIAAADAQPAVPPAPGCGCTAAGMCSSPQVRPGVWVPVSSRKASQAVVRAADSDRDEAIEVLRQAAGDGRLSIAELEDRIEQVMAAKTYRDLAVTVADLPAVMKLPRSRPVKPARPHHARDITPRQRPGYAAVPVLLIAGWLLFVLAAHIWGPLVIPGITCFVLAAKAWIVIRARGRQ